MTRSVPAIELSTNPYGVGGAPGALSHSAGNLTWGTTGDPPQKTITLTGIGGTMTAGRLSFVGVEADSFQVVSRGGDSLPTPHDCGNDGDFHFAFNNDTTFGIVFETLFADETEQTMDVEVYSANGDLVATILASATYEDPIIAAVASIPGAMAMYSARGLGLGSIGNNQVGLEDISLNGEASLVTDTDTYSQAAGWSIVSTAGFSIPSLSQAFRTVQTAGRQPAGITAVLASDVHAGIAVIRINSGGAIAGIFRTGGTRANYQLGSINPATLIRNPGDGINLWHEFSNYAAGSGYNPATPTAYLSVAFRRVGGTTYLWISTIGGVFGDLAATTGAGAWTPTNGFTTGIYNHGSADGNVSHDIVCFIPCDSTVTAADLETIHNTFA